MIWIPMGILILAVISATTATITLSGEKVLKALLTATVLFVVGVVASFLVAFCITWVSVRSFSAAVEMFLALWR
jgi:hypothetical protein